MKRLFASIILLLTLTLTQAKDFDASFTDNTLRIEVGVKGPGPQPSLTIDSIAQWPGWYGRRVNLTKEQYPEELQILVIDQNTNDTLYVDSRCSTVISEEPGVDKEHIQMFVPKPKDPCTITVNLYGYGPGERKPMVTTSTNLSASALSDMAARSIVNDYRTLRAAASPARCINLAIVAEGYTVAETEAFYHKAQMLDSALFSQPAFKPQAKKFNVVAVMIPSQQSGITVPSANKNVNSALGAHFDSFGMERLVTISNTKVLWDALENVPAQHIIILANTDKYGGSGSHNEYAIGADGIPHFQEVVIHEFGHSFGALADEYESGFDDLYNSESEPPEPNITTLHDFSGKWQSLIDSGEASLIEGGGYQDKGVWRGCQNCLMRAIADHDFCAVCAQAIERTVKYYVGEQ